MQVLDWLACLNCGSDLSLRDQLPAENEEVDDGAFSTSAVQATTPLAQMKVILALGNAAWRPVTRDMVRPGGCDRITANATKADMAEFR